MNKNKTVSFVKFLFFIFFVFIFFWFTDPANLITFLSNQNFLMVLKLILLLHLSYIIYALRWTLIVNFPLKEHNLSKPFLNYLVSLFYNSFTPANIGGDIYRIYADSSSTNSKTKIISLLLYERILGLILFAFFSILALRNVISFLLIQNYSQTFLIFFLIIFFAIIFVLFVLKKPIIKLIQNNLKIYESLLTVKNTFLNKQLTVLCFIISFIGIFISVKAFNFLLFHNGITIPFWKLFGIYCAIELIRAIPISYQGFGFREAFFAFCLMNLEISSFEDAIYLSGFYYIIVSLALAII